MKYVLEVFGPPPQHPHYGTIVSGRPGHRFGLLSTADQLAHIVERAKFVPNLSAVERPRIKLQLFPTDRHGLVNKDRMIRDYTYDVVGSQLIFRPFG